MFTPSTRRFYFQSLAKAFSPAMYLSAPFVSVSGSPPSGVLASTCTLGESICRDAAKSWWLRAAMWLTGGPREIVRQGAAQETRFLKSTTRSYSSVMAAVALVCLGPDGQPSRWYLLFTRWAINPICHISRQRKVVRLRSPRTSSGGLT
jgi:hypothetical protein